MKFASDGSEWLTWRLYCDRIFFLVVDIQIIIVIISFHDFSLFEIDINRVFMFFSDIRRKFLETGEFGGKLLGGKLILAVVRHLFVLPVGEGSLV